MNRTGFFLKQKLSLHSLEVQNVSFQRGAWINRVQIQVTLDFPTVIFMDVLKWKILSILSKVWFWCSLFWVYCRSHFGHFHCWYIFQLCKNQNILRWIEIHPNQTTKLNASTCNQCNILYTKVMKNGVICSKNMAFIHWNQVTLYTAHSGLLLKATIAKTRCISFICVAAHGARYFRAYVMARRWSSARTNSTYSWSLNWNSNLLCHSKKQWALKALHQIF